ncbi:MAG: hypothetical protein H6807_00270 [Planctomycetes bacterium]|nr:hypothetical protein [Planctomycetota bacterium]
MTDAKLPTSDSTATSFPRLVVIHLWYLEADELSRLLLGAPGRFTETRFCPRFTDCSESLAFLGDLPVAEAQPEIRALLEGRVAAAPGLPPAIEGRRLDERIVAIWLEREPPRP